MYTTWMGIDPGLKGGIAVIYSNRKPQAIPLPLKDGKLDLVKISQEIDRMLEYDLEFGYRPTLVYVEDVHAMPGQGVTSMFNFGFGVGALHGILAAKDLDVGRVNPIRWKNRVLQNKTRDKTVAIAYCKDHFPEVHLIPAGSRKDHDGMADALCIAEYARKFHAENTMSPSSGTRKGKRAASAKRRS